MLVANTGDGDAVLPSAKSAAGLAVVTTGGVTLFVKFGSALVEVTLAALVRLPRAAAVTVTVRLLVPAFGKLPRFQVTVPTPLLPLPLALTKFTPTGSGSVTTTFVAVAGPRLVTLTV